jgi:hypothetical protein
MKTLIAALFGLCISAVAVLSTSCGSFTGDGFTLGDFDLPIEIGVAYELEPGLSIVVMPADKGGIEVTFEGEGQISDNIRKIPGGFEVTSGDSGIVWRITEGSNGKPRITIVAEGDGKLAVIVPEK